MKGYMYILLCNDGSYYTGSTSNLHKRIKQHFAGEGANHTKKHPPVKLLYYEEFSRIDDAFYREKQVQGWSRKKKEALINGEYEKLPELSKSYSKRSVVPSTSSGTTSTKETVPSTSSGTRVLSVAEPVEATVTSSGTTSTKETVPSTSSGTDSTSSGTDSTSSGTGVLSVAEPVEATVTSSGTTSTKETVPSTSSGTDSTSSGTGVLSVAEPVEATAEATFNNTNKRKL